MTMTVTGCGPALDGARAGPAVAGDQRRRGAGEQQRLVADVAGHVGLGIHPVGPRQAPAVAARQRHRLVARRLQALAQMDDERRLAGAAGREIADADDRQPRAVGRRRASSAPSAAQP